jgi:hypothetical protein
MTSINPPQVEQVVPGSAGSKRIWTVEVPYAMAFDWRIADGKVLS